MDRYEQVVMLQDQGESQEFIADALGLTMSLVGQLMYRHTIDTRIWRLQDQGMKQNDIRRMILVSDRRIAIANERRQNRGARCR